MFLAVGVIVRDAPLENKSWLSMIHQHRKTAGRPTSPAHSTRDVSHWLNTNKDAPVLADFAKWAARLLAERLTRSAICGIQDCE
jgi:hypothetical protein